MVLLAAVLVRTALFVPEVKKPATIESVCVDVGRAAEELSSLIKCKTVSDRNSELEDEGEFKRFEELLRKLFPNLHNVCTFEKVGPRALLYRWKGRSSEHPTVLMAHYDVVGAEESEWTVSAFGGEISQEFLYGRGALDTKVTLSSMLHSAERLICEGFIPRTDVYFAFGGDEEIGGRGASDIVALFEQRGIFPALVLDEGGAVVKHVFPGVKKKVALIGVAEKGMANISYTAKSNGGHASTPKQDTPVTKLARAATRVNSRPFPFRITEPTHLMLDKLARHSTFGYRVIFANLWLFSPVLNLITRKGGELGAIVRTTTAFTEMHGAVGMNVIPPTASLISNHRILPGETPDTVKKRVERSVGDPDVTVEIVSAQLPSTISRTDCEEYKKIEKTIEEVWQNIIVSPYLMLACSDSRHWGRISDRVYRFSPLEFVEDERASIHGNDERISLKSLEKTVEFFIRFIKQC